jgi:hypothetical protein
MAILGLGRWSVLALLALLAVAGCAGEPDRAREVARVRAHLERIEREMLATTPPDLTADQATRRAEVLRDLHRYIEAERYPTNRIFEEPIPIFIDDDGARCAVAALLEASGHHALVARIARTRNLAYVEELADEPELVAWLVDHGVLLREAARIQPTYDFARRPKWWPTGALVAGVDTGTAPDGDADFAFAPGVRLGVRRSIEYRDGGCSSCFTWSAALMAEYSRSIIAGGGSSHHLALLAEYERDIEHLFFHWYVNGGPVVALDRDAEPGSGIGGQVGGGLSFRQAPYPVFFGLTASVITRTGSAGVRAGANLGIVF